MTGTTAGVRCGARFRTRDEITARARRVANGLRAAGVQPGDRVAIVLRNEIEFLEVTLGAAQAGASPVSVNWHWRADELGYLLRDCEAVLAFVHSDLVATVRDAAPGLRIVEVPTTAALREAWSLDEGGEPEYEAWLADAGDAVGPDAPPQLGMLYSSGTTGRPKGILREPATERQSALLAERILAGFDLREGESTLLTAPMYHAAPHAQALFGLSAGCEVTIMPRFSAAGFLAAVERYAVTHAQTVPTMFVRLLQLPDDERARHDLTSLRRVVHGAGPCAPAVKRAMIDWWGPILLEYYGGTEVGTSVVCDSDEWLAHPGTVGRPLPGVDIRIHREDGGLAPTGESGEIFIDPGEAWPGSRYVGAAAGSGQRRRGTYTSIGDAGWLDADGYLHLSDRLADMVVSGGVNLYPVEIEQCLATMPGVRDSAAFGVPDDVYGERLVVHVDTDRDPHEVREHLAQRLSREKVPRDVVIDHDLPREESGKLLKRRVRQRYLGDEHDRTRR